MSLRLDTRVVVFQLLVTVALLAPAGRARGDAYEGFAYPPGPGATAPLNGGTGFLGS